MGMDDGTKTCPLCGETIQARAVVCRFCNYDYRTGTRQGAPRTNGYAIASLVLGILWIYWIGSILALILGYMARNEIDSSGGGQTGRGLATAGIVLGWVGVATLALVVLLIPLARSF